MTLGLALRVAQLKSCPCRQILSNSVDICDRLDRRQLTYTGIDLFLLQWVLTLSFTAARLQKVNDLQQDNLCI